MEPRPAAPHSGLERLSSENNQKQERSPSSSPEISGERFVESSEKTQTVSAAQDQVALPVLPQPLTVTAAPVNSTGTTDDNVTSSAPMVASDDDLIEKEWVDKAKKIIVETRNDPYRREQEVGRLQADYLRKRYGKELGVSK
jgi:hypothetical protein